MRKLMLSLTIGVFTLAQLQAQVDPRGTVDEYLDAYIDANAKPYIQPLADMVTTNINTGVWDWASIPDKIYFRIKVNGMVSFPSDEMRSFEATTPTGFTPVQTVTVPTVVGDNHSVLIQGDNNLSFAFPQGFDLDRVLLGTPQVTIGGLLNTEVSGRFLSFPLNEDQDIIFYGLGARHSLSSYFDNPAFDLSVGYFYHHINADTYVNSNQHLFSVLLGKSGKLFSGHVGVGYQTSMHHLEYTFEDGAQSRQVNIDMDNSNPFIVEAGLGFKLGPLFINGAASYAKFASLSLGAGLSF